MQVEIKILPEAEIKREMKIWSDRAMKGRMIKGKTTIFLTPELFPQIFTRKRLELLMELRKAPVGTISELAERLNRPFETVHRDLKFLESYDLVKLTKNRKSVIPELTGEIRWSMPATA